MQTLLDDNELIELISGKNTSALEVLIERYRDYAYNIAIKVTGNREMAEEAVRDSFLKVYQYAGSFKRKAKFSTWLYRIVYTTALATRQTQSNTAGRMEFPEHFGQFEMVVQPVVMHDRECRKKEIDMALKRLPVEYSLVLTLYYLNEQSIEEISLILGETKDSIKVRLFRARKKVKDILQHLKL